MTSEHPHPQRCETCKHKLPDCDKEDLGSRVCKKIFLEDPKSLQIGIPYFINMVGCASHSAAPERLCDECDIIEVEERLINAEQDLKGAKEQAKREERERVLEDLWKFCLINGAEEHGDLIGYPSGDSFFTLKLLKRIAEMRYESTRGEGK